MNKNIALIAFLAVACCLAGGTSPAVAAIQPSSDLLLPYFEVDTQSASGRTTLFALCNHSEKPVEVLVSVHTNWGIPVLDLSLTLDASQVRTVNLRDWFLTGDLPDRKLNAEEISQIQAALSGRASPRDARYFSTEIEPGLAVGSITFRVRGVRRPEVLWGDFFVVDPAEDHLQAEALVSLGRSSAPECVRHGVRFLAGGDFEAGTELVIWTGQRVEPSSSPEFPDTSRMTVDVEVYNEAGREIGHHRLSLLPVQKVDVASIELSEPFGWLDVVTEAASIVTARYGMEGRSGVPVQTFCLPAESLQIGPALRIEQFVNGEEAAVPPGPFVAAGSSLQWTYTVTNAGSVPLDSVLVTNSLGIPVECPESSLGPGSTMTCAATRGAEVCTHEVIATASGVPPSGSPVVVQDTSYYTGDEGAAIEVELLINGKDADEPPGPTLIYWGPSVPWFQSLTWGFIVRNAGTVPLSNVRVFSGIGPEFIECPANALAPGESMTCTQWGAIAPGANVNFGEATGTSHCGRAVSDRDFAHYFGEPVKLSLSLEILVNEQDASQPPGPEVEAGYPFNWTFVVGNTGNVSLSLIKLFRSTYYQVSCPLSYLAPGETMSCMETGFTGPGNQQVTATVQGGVYFRYLLASTSTTAAGYYVGVIPTP
ncbi:MAG TPA: hypothetical protein VJ725_24250 [Thermoanaerobaculia bacterium]|nr:hypothetical protein [Thermoanaerobaculia bacterium]